jgi:hypothetical protein
VFQPFARGAGKVPLLDKQLILMITYEVTAVVDPVIISAYEEYMRTRHIPDLLATGCFVAASFSRTAGSRYRMRYEAADQAALDRYFAEHAATLREHVHARFPDGIQFLKEEWTVIQQWREEG